MVGEEDAVDSGRLLESVEKRTGISIRDSPGYAGDDGATRERERSREAETPKSAMGSV